MENQKSKFLFLKSKSKRVRLGLISFVSCLILAFACGILVLSDTALADKPDKPPGQGKKGDDDASQDMPLCIVFDGGEIEQPFIINGNPLCASSKGVTAFAGRNRTITLKIHKNTSDPSLVLFLTPLSWVEGDPDPATDGGYYDGPGQEKCPTPDLVFGGRISGPSLRVGMGVNVKDISEGTLLGTDGRLHFKDDLDQEYQLFWGPDPMPWGPQRTNPSAPYVDVLRNADVDGKRNWDVSTVAEASVGGRDGAHTAFLWWALSPHGPHDYCGAYNVSFSYIATEE